MNVFLVVWKTSDIPKNALSLIVHTVQTLNNTVYAPYSNSIILLTWTVHHLTSLYIHCSALNNNVLGYWNTLNRTEQHCKRVLIYIVQNESKLYGVLKYLVQNWTTLHRNTDLQFIQPNNTAREHWSTLYRTEQHSGGLYMMRLYANVTLYILCWWLFNKSLII